VADPIIPMHTCTQALRLFYRPLTEMRLPWSVPLFRVIAMQSSLCRTDYFCMHSLRLHSAYTHIQTFVLRLALEAELGAACRGHGSPMLLVSRLAVVTNAVGLPWLIESLEVEEVDVPGKHTADSRFVVGCGV